MIELSSPNCWGMACLCALLKASTSATPVAFLYNALFSGDLRPEYGWQGEPLHGTKNFKITIQGDDLSDAAFKSQQQNLIETTFLVLLDDCLRRSELSAGFIWTAILHYVALQVDEDCKSSFLKLSHGLQFGSKQQTGEVAARDPTIGYHPLPQDGATIRILVLLPATSFDRSIRCQLAYERLSDVSYEALSYVWGDPSITQNITVDDQKMPVTINLYEALKHLRSRSKPRILWVDAICIDQSNVKERDSQVQLMGKIYSEAHKVLIWLGPDSKTTPKAWECVYGNPYSAPEARILYRMIMEQVLDGTVAQSRAHQTRFSLTGGPGPEARDAVAEICTRPWFSRNWIVQEAVLAKTADVQCGNNIMSLAILELCFFQFHGSTSYKVDDIAKAVRSIAFFNIMDLSHPITTLDLMDTARSMQCYDPRDKVYSILHIDARRSQENYLVVTPNYSISAEDLYIQSAKSIITRSKSMDILSRVQTLRPRRSRMLPSWAPDWREGSWQTTPWDIQSTSDIVPAYLLLRGRRHEAFNAGGDSASSHEPRFSLNDRILETRGILLDTIACEGTKFGHSGSEALAHTIEQCLCTFEDYLGKPRVSFVEEFWRAIVMGYQLPHPTTLEDTEQWRNWNTFRITSKDFQTRIPGVSSIPPETQEEQQLLIEHIARCMFYPAFHGALRMFVTTGEAIVLGPKEAQIGDIVAIFQNTHMPYVLKKSLNLFSVVGPW